MKILVLAFSLFCFSAISFAGTTMIYINYGGVQRDFLVHVPPGFDSTSRLPVVLNLHGYNMTGTLEEAYTQMSLCADSNNFLAVYPDGINYAWNVGWSFAGGAYGTGVDDVGFISAVIDYMIGNYHIDQSRVYACGLSNGGFMSHRLACELNHRIAAIATVSGPLSDSVAFYCNQSRPIPVLMMHGTADTVVPYFNPLDCLGAEESVGFWMGKDQCTNANDTTAIPDVNTADSSTVLKIHYGGCASGSEVLFYKIIGGGHSWPGSPLNAGYGAENRDMNANSEIWSFFKQYYLPASVGINEVESSVELKIFPNPVSDEIKIESNLIITRVEIFNVIGEKTSSSQLNATSTSLNTSNWQKGIYFVKVYGSGYTSMQKICKD
ncbi:MAG: hypothetical protein JWO06_908 [Bacteroidota bacterium]|nr:hypothetical protein [Bacteroidota bacterium]